MVKLKYTDLISQINKNQISPVYLFVGKEEYLKEQALHFLAKKIVNEQSKYFDYELFYAADTNANTVIDTVCTLPFMSSKKLVVVKNVDEWYKKDKSVILEYLNNHAKTSCLVFTADEFDYKDSLYKKIEEFNGVINFWVLFESDTKKWIVDRFNKNNKTIESPAVDTLYEYGGEYLANLEKEIEKVVVYVNDRKEVTLEDIEFVSGHTRAETINQLLDKIGDKNVKDSLLILNELFEEGEHPIKILNWLTTRIKQMLIAQHLRKSVANEDSIFWQIRLFDKKSKIIFFRQLKKFTQDKLITMYNRCLYADWDLKTSKKTPKIVLQNLLLDVTVTTN